MQQNHSPRIPSWLASAFPGWSWRSLRCSTLRVHAERGAGLDVEASEHGYLIDSIDDTEGVDEALQPGATIVSIAGEALMGLDEDAIEAVFGKHFQDGAELLVIDTEELKNAAAERNVADSSVEAEQQTPEVIEVAGMVMQSLPARKRRRRQAEVHIKGGNGKDDANNCAHFSHANDEAGVAAEIGGLVTTLRGKPPASLTSKVSASSDSSELRQFEYMDHTADVILHSWGSCLEEAFAQVCVCFFSYMTDLDTVEPRSCIEVEASGHDILDLLYHLLDEFLFSFGTEYIICRRVEVVSFDLDGLKIKAKGYGERFNLQKHPQGTEIKAITMHQMKILTPETLTSEEGVVARKQSSMEGGREKDGFPYECYVLVDI